MDISLKNLAKKIAILVDDTLTNEEKKILDTLVIEKVTYKFDTVKVKSIITIGDTSFIHYTSPITSFWYDRLMCTNGNIYYYLMPDIYYLTLKPPVDYQIKWNEEQGEKIIEYTISDDDTLMSWFSVNRTFGVNL
jgi:hypothetical protein